VSITTPPTLLATSQLRVTLALAAIPRSDRLTPKALPVTLTVRRRSVEQRDFRRPCQCPKLSRCQQPASQFLARGLQFSSTTPTQQHLLSTAAGLPGYSQNDQVPAR